MKPSDRLSNSFARLLRDDSGVTMMTYVVFAVLLVAAVVASVIVFGGRTRDGIETAGHAAGGGLKTAKKTAEAASENFEVAIAKAIETGAAIQGGEFGMGDGGNSEGGDGDGKKKGDGGGKPPNAPARVLVGEAEQQYSAWKSFWEGFIVGDNYELYGDDIYRYRGGWMVAGQFVNIVTIGAVQKVEYGITWAATHWGDEDQRGYGLDKAADGAIQIGVEVATAGAIHGAGKVFSKFSKARKAGDVAGKTGSNAGKKGDVVNLERYKAEKDGKVVKLDDYRKGPNKNKATGTYGKSADNTTGVGHEIGTTGNKSGVNVHDGNPNAVYDSVGGVGGNGNPFYRIGKAEPGHNQSSGNFNGSNRGNSNGGGMPQKKGGGETPVSKTTSGENNVVSLEDYLKQKGKQNQNEISIDTSTADKYNKTIPVNGYKNTPKPEVGGKLNIDDGNL